MVLVETPLGSSRRVVPAPERQGASAPRIEIYPERLPGGQGGHRPIGLTPEPSGGWWFVLSGESSWPCETGSPAGSSCQLTVASCQESPHGLARPGLRPIRDAPTVRCAVSGVAKEFRARRLRPSVVSEQGVGL